CPVRVWPCGLLKAVPRSGTGEPTRPALILGNRLKVNKGSCWEGIMRREIAGAIRIRRRRRLLRPAPAPPTWSAHHGGREASGVSRGGLALAAGGLALSAVLALAASVGPTRANGAEPSPLSVVQALMDAEHETDLELALSLFAKDAVIMNVTGGT